MEDSPRLRLGSELLKPAESPIRPNKKIALTAVFFLSGCFWSGACATGGPAAKGSFVVDVKGGRGFSGPAAFTVRDSGVPESVVTVEGVGEVIVKGDGTCRFVRADKGISDLQILESKVPCAELRGDRLCFDHFVFQGASRVAVDGCADRNEVFLERNDTAHDVASFAPRTLIERCVPVPKDDPRYLRVDDIRVDGVDNARRGLRFRWNGDGFDVCFLSQKTGRYKALVHVDDKDLVVAGDVGDI